MEKDKIRDQIIIALDFEELDKALSIAASIKEQVTTVKVGWQLFINHGYSAVVEMKKLGLEVFLDLKLHDIPFQVSVAARRIVREEVRMFTCHTLGGAEMMRQLRENVAEEARKSSLRAPEIFGVTVLTSLDDKDLDLLGLSGPPENTCLRLARLAEANGLDGVVSSPLELPFLREALESGFKIMTPGIRPDGTGPSDQKRFLTPPAAFKAGADYLIIGRPVTQAKDPAAALAGIISSLA